MRLLLTQLKYAILSMNIMLILQGVLGGPLPVSLDNDLTIKSS